MGKSSTGECIAEQLERPLLPITCGDIGTDVKEAEETLSRYCALAYRWRCVLLLDEADIFLTKRESGDLLRNGLVSGQSPRMRLSRVLTERVLVFLRVLEYYSGVIILTTNRVGEFDEAFRSRIHISLYYPKLDYASTSKIWKRNLEFLKNSGLDIEFDEDEISSFSERHWQANIDKPSRRWNGRQIKNAFQTAIGLANWDLQEVTQTERDKGRPRLEAKHFERVAATSAHFDDYISDVHNINTQDTYGVLAERAELRKDNHPAMSSNKSRNEDNTLRSRRNPLPRREYGGRNTRAKENASRTRDQNDQVDDDDDDVEVLELKLKLAEKKKQKQLAKKKEVEVQSAEEEDEQW